MIPYVHKNEPNIVETKLTCPKCNSKDLYLMEIWNNFVMDWIQQDGKFDVNSGNQEIGSPCKVEARCDSCFHLWTVRGAKQIGDIYELEKN